MQKPKGNPFKKELSDVSFEVVHTVKPKSAGVYRQPKKKVRVPRVVAVAHPILSGALKRPASAAPAAGRMLVPEPEPEPEPEPKPEAEPEEAEEEPVLRTSGAGGKQAWVGEEGDEAAAGEEEFTVQPEEFDVPPPAALSVQESSRGRYPGAGVDPEVSVAVRPRRETRHGDMDRSARVRHAPGARPMMAYEKAWARNPGRGEWYLSNGSGVDTTALGVSASMPDMGRSGSIVSRRQRRESNGIDTSAATAKTTAQRSKLNQRRVARARRERQGLTAL